MLHNVVGYYRFMMQQSLPLRVSLSLAILTFPLAITLTLVCLIIDCSYSTLARPCSFLVPTSPTDCSDQGQDYCCGGQGQL